MRKYEIMVIIDPDVDERQVPALLEKHLLVITNGKGTVDGQDIWGRRRMAYEINKHFTLMAYGGGSSGLYQDLYGMGRLVYAF